MKPATNVAEIKANAREFAKRLDELFQEFNSNAPIGSFIMLFDEEQLMQDNIPTEQTIPVGDNECFVVLGTNDGKYIDLSS